ncbi:hypothetical protein H6G97_12595 [Nostoc flagelliforme FACHB-838]|uniref:Uncharacterized protein n=1 Tax=Nostoc flagelliforme FACHB-838 TaxID=2692904 RepID=A0ABR8DN74_9NOSO|nr:hypothetical protein [Nostoc flagelliforme]MBD2530366.1 hypothetical protein [Nostoc flagelliforme FACHB-838]
MKLASLINKAELSSVLLAYRTLPERVSKLRAVFRRQASAKVGIAPYPSLP